ncbi:MAG: SDR family NAD(P)-dependent oxidoreductase [Gaiellaceae bacterium]
MDLSGKRAIVTGASSGIGAATTRALREAGARVVGGARRVEKIDADVALQLDVTDPESCASFVERALADGRIDILVNNAGLALGRSPFIESTEDDERRMLETNVNGLIRMTRLCLPHLLHGGHIVNLGSVAALWPYEKGTVYCLSKAAVHAFSRGLREDLLGQPVRMTTIAPGMVDETEFSKVRFGGDETQARAVYENVGLGGPLRAQDVADCILFAVTRPPNVNIDEIVIMALAQSSGARIVRQ